MSVSPPLPRPSPSRLRRFQGQRRRRRDWLHPPALSPAASPVTPGRHGRWGNGGGGHPAAAPTAGGCFAPHLRRLGRGTGAREGKELPAAAGPGGGSRPALRSPVASPPPVPGGSTGGDAEGKPTPPPPPPPFLPPSSPGSLARSRRPPRRAPPHLRPATRPRPQTRAGRRGTGSPGAAPGWARRGHRPRAGGSFPPAPGRAGPAPPALPAAPGRPASMVVTLAAPARPALRLSLRLGGRRFPPAGRVRGCRRAPAGPAPARRLGWPRPPVEAPPRRRQAPQPGRTSQPLPLLRGGRRPAEAWLRRRLLVPACPRGAGPGGVSWARSGTRRVSGQGRVAGPGHGWV